MANMSYTLADLARAVTHALAGAPDANLSPNEIVNDAIQWLSRKASWRWKQKALALSSVNGQTYIALPADFEAIETIKLVSSGTSELRPATLDTIVQMRAIASGNSDVYYCLNYIPQTSTTAEPTPILEIFPTPSASVAYLVGIYLRQIPKLASDGDRPDIPSVYHTLVKAACRAMAVAQEEQQFGSDWQVFNEMLPDYLRVDGESPGYLGRARGGLSTMSRTAGLAAQTKQIG